jgi:hypothetical protein
MSHHNGQLAELLDELEVFCGDISNAEARVYTRLPRPTGDGALRLTGTISGPYSRYNQTLAAKLPFVDRGPGDTLLAEAIIPDPCFWSPDLPLVYRAEIELQRLGETIARGRRLVGIRPLGVRGSKLIYDNRSFVLRAVHWDDVPPTPLAQWREESTAVAIDDPDDAWLDEASRTGIWVIARIGEGSNLSVELRRLAQWPAVALIAVSSARDSRPACPAGNILLAAIIEEENRPVPWAHVAITDSNLLRAEPSVTPQTRPVMVERRGKFASVADARKACDQLQAELAPRGQFAGYCV